MPENLADNDNHQDGASDSLKTKLAAFDRELKAQEAAIHAPQGMSLAAASYSRGYARASRIALELVVAILAGCGLGFGLDKMAGTMPLFILLGSLLGFCAGVLNAWRALNGTYGKVGFDQVSKKQDL